MNQVHDLPASPECEKSILGAVLLDNSIASEALITLKSEHFFLDAHRRIYQRLADLAEQGRPLDIVSLTECLMSHKELEAVGGAGYLASLTDGVPRRSSLEHYVRIVRDKFLVRSAIHAANAVIATALEQGQGATALLQSALSRFMQLSVESIEHDVDVFVDVADFCAGPDIQPDWLVEGLIERGSNGIVAADPKGMKSLTTAYLAACLGLGLPWLRLAVKQRVRVALVSREDNPETTKRRLKHIVRGMGADMEELRGWVHVNSKKQSPSLMLDNPREVANLIRCIKKWDSEFIIFDVLNKLHSQDENDNTKLRMVMNQIDRIQVETGAQACVLHHLNKGDAGQSITRRLRGAGAIAGFAEWIAGIELEDEASHVRCMRFETKAGGSLKPIYYVVSGDEAIGPTYFNVVRSIGEIEPEPKRRWEQ
jgi:NACalpha-BTF3-like transcription factor